MEGIIYIVTNTINSKVYIGKTYLTLDERWKIHVQDTYRTDRVDRSKFHRAIFKYGFKNFIPKELGRFEQGILEQKEIEYIAKYDSYHNGYNSTLGGDGALKVIFNDEEAKDILKRFDNKETMAAIAEKYNVSTFSIRKLLVANNRQIVSYPEKSVVKYDIHFNPLDVYDTVLSILDDIIIDGYSSNKRNLYRYIKEATNTGCVRYGHRWQLASDLEYDNKIFRTKFDKEAYIKGGTAYQPEGKQYYIVDGALNKILGIKDIKEDKNVKIKCKVCGKDISIKSKTGMCNSCANVAARGKSPKPSKEELLADLVDLNKRQIAKKYGRTVSTICAWCNSYGI